MGNYKKGLDYFKHDVDMSTADQEIELMEAEFGLKGYAIYLKLLEKIYGENGYYMEWNKDIRLLFARRVGEDGALVDEIVNGLLRRGLFNQPVFESSAVLTSASIQTRYLDATKRREQVDIEAEYLLIPPDVYNEYDNVNIKGQDVNIDKHSREEKSTEEKSTEQGELSRARTPPGKRELEGFEKYRGTNLSFLDVDDWMDENGIDISAEEFEYELERFRDKFSGKRYKDWVATFRNYLRSRYLEPEHWDYKSSTETNSTNGPKTRGDRQMEQYF